jgi:hypothetical protein
MAIRGGNFDVNTFIGSNPSPYQGGRIPLAQQAQNLASGSGGGTQAPAAPVQQPAGPPALSAEQIYANQLAAQAAAQARAEEAQRGQLRGDIGTNIRNAQNAYSQLYGDVTGAATSQRQALDQRYGKETQALGEQFNQELPGIGRAYAARGAFDSSYRMDAEEAAQKQFQRQLEDIGSQREADAAKIGQYVAEQQAKIQAEQGILGTIGGRLGQTTDLNELMQLRNQLERQIADTQSQRAGAMSQQQLMQRFGQLAPANDRLATLQGTLSQIMQSAAPQGLKVATAQQLIGSAGLSPEEQNRLQQQIIQPTQIA